MTGPATNFKDRPPERFPWKPVAALFLVLALPRCSSHKTPDLPELNQDPLPLEEILLKQEDLKKRTEKARKEHRNQQAQNANFRRSDFGVRASPRK